MTDYDLYAEAFMEARSPTVGVAVVRGWARSLPDAGRVLDLGCGHGIPVSRALAGAGLTVHGVDTSPRLLREFRRNVTGATAERADASTVELAAESFDGVVAWGLVFLLEPSAQASVIRRAASALRPGGSFLMTAPTQVAEWMDTVTGTKSVSLGQARYRELFAEAGLTVLATHRDEGQNHYWITRKSPTPSAR